MMTTQQATERVQHIESYLPRVIPAEWVPIRGSQPWGSSDPYGAGYDHARAPMRVLISAKRELDERVWVHLSISHQRRLPTWEELRDAKDIFFGRERMAIQVVPRAAEHYNHMSTCLHLWCCWEADPIPDFRVDGKI